MVELPKHPSGGDPSDYWSVSMAVADESGEGHGELYVQGPQARGRSQGDARTRGVSVQHLQLVDAGGDRDSARGRRGGGAGARGSGCSAATGVTAAAGGVGSPMREGFAARWSSVAAFPVSQPAGTMVVGGLYGAAGLAEGARYGSAPKLAHAGAEGPCALRTRAPCRCPGRCRSAACVRGRRLARIAASPAEHGDGGGSQTASPGRRSRPGRAVTFGGRSWHGGRVLAGAVARRRRRRRFPWPRGPRVGCRAGSSGDWALKASSASAIDREVVGSQDGR